MIVRFAFAILMATVGHLTLVPPLSAMAADAPAAAAIVLESKANASTIDAKVGDILEIRLIENASTGYSWAVDSLDETRIKLVGKTTEAGEAMPGAPGTAVYRLEVLQVGESKVGLKYVRPWEANGEPAERFAVTVAATAR